MTEEEFRFKDTRGDRDPNGWRSMDSAPHNRRIQVYCPPGEGTPGQTFVAFYATSADDPADSQWVIAKDILPTGEHITFIVHGASHWQECPLSPDGMRAGALKTKIIATGQGSTRGST